MCVIGAGCSGLAALRELVRRGFDVDCFEQGSRVGGTWRYENDNGRSAAFASLRTNVSRPRMQYPSLPMPSSYGDFPHHSQMAAYLEAYAAAFDLHRHVRFRTLVEQVTPSPDGEWCVALGDGSEYRYESIVVANGHDWEPNWPQFRGDTTARVTHAHQYRTPDAFAGQRVLVIGAGQSGCEIACEISKVASLSLLSSRGGVHVVPRYVLGDPYDDGDRAPFNLLPWSLLRALFASLVTISRAGRPADYGLPEPRHKLLEQIPAISSDIVPALRRGDVVPVGNIERLEGGFVHLAGGEAVQVDRIICATGYRISCPFLAPELLGSEDDRRAVPLYRRIVSPQRPGLFFIGLADPPGGLLPVVEAQSAWLGDVLCGAIKLPPPERMWRAIGVGERRSRKRFPDEPPHSIRFDPHAYRRLLARDRLRARASNRWPSSGSRGRPSASVRSRLGKRSGRAARRLFGNVDARA